MKNGLLTIILAFICGGLICYLLINSNNVNISSINDSIKYDNTVTEKINYTSKTMAGLYRYTSDKSWNESGDNYFVTYYIYLYENGMYQAGYDFVGNVGYVGNYVIEDNIIKLNNIFDTTSGTGIYVNLFNTELLIKDENTLINNNPISMVSDKIATMEVKKQSDNEKFTESFERLNYILNNYYISNNYHD